MTTEIIAFIGAGNMATSLINGLLASGHPAAWIRVSDPVESQRERLDTLGVRTFADNADAGRDAAVVVLAVKPQVVGPVLQSLALTPQQLLLSIAAGVPIASLEAWSADRQPVVRCMPNTPALLGAGITGLYANSRVTREQRAAAETLLASAGRTLWVAEESLLDAVTAVSGSGPAYFFYLMEAMIEAGMTLGLDRVEATELTLETAYGAALMARERTTPPAGLRANVTSPGGTTERALSILDAADARSTIVQAIQGAAARARQLAEEFGQP